MAVPMEITLKATATGASRLFIAGDLSVNDVLNKKLSQGNTKIRRNRNLIRAGSHIILFSAPRICFNLARAGAAK
jgi:hypothetical protein